MEYCRAYWKNLPLFLFIKYWMVQTGKAINRCTTERLVMQRAILGLRWRCIFASFILSKEAKCQRIDDRQKHL